MELEKLAYNSLSKEDFLFAQKWIENTKEAIQDNNFNLSLCKKAIFSTIILTKNKEISLQLDKEIKEIVDVLINKSNNTAMFHTVEILKNKNPYVLFLFEQLIKTRLQY